MTGGSKMKYGKKKAVKKIKKPIKKKGIKKGYSMSDEKKDVTVHVTGVSMSGGVKNDSKRSVTTDQEKSGKGEARDS